MEQAGVRRRLAAILSADVAGYSRLMGVDEEATLSTLGGHREAMDGLIAAHHGRVVGTAGDSVLAEFASVVEAVRCAAEIQREIAARNDGIPDDRKMAFRIGVNLGDVMVKDGDIFGDGVNVAARLESLAEPGGICISGAVFDQVKSRLELRYEDLGERKVKNIAEPVRVYRVGMERKTPVVDPDAAALKAPDRPSVGVLPFANMSGDPEQEYFSDGLTEDIITELSKFRELFVIARNSTFAYRGKDVNIQEIGKDLGIRYIVEGSVRKAGSRVRISAQLIDAATGNHVWAQRYDRDLEDIFAVQDEITQTVVASLAGRLEVAELERAKRKPIESMAAYDYLLRGKDHHHRFTKEDNALGLRALHKAVELDPGCAPAYAWLACTYGQAWVRGYLEDTDMARERSIEAAQKSYALDESDAECHRILCSIHLLQRQYDQAEFHQDRAIALNPNAPLIVSQRGYLLTILGRADEGVEWVQKAMRLDPIRPDLFGNNLGIALFATRRYPEAVRALTRITGPRLSHHAYLAACYAEMDAPEELQGRRAKILELEPNFSARGHAEGEAFKEPADEKHLRDALIKAGLPE